jgi:hypothetical protein
MAFSRNFMRNDQTNKSEMPKMKTSSATAVSSTPFHKRHYLWSASGTLVDVKTSTHHVNAMLAIRNTPGRR